MNPVTTTGPVRSRPQAWVLGGMLTVIGLGTAGVWYLAGPNAATGKVAHTPEAEAFEGWVLRHLDAMHELAPDRAGTDGAPARAGQVAFNLRVGSRSYPCTLECQWRNSVMGANSAFGHVLQERTSRLPHGAQGRTFMVLGIGGAPDAPSELFIIPAHGLPSDRVTMDYLERFRQPMTGGHFHYDPFGGVLHF